MAANYKTAACERKRWQGYRAKESDVSSEESEDESSDSSGAEEDAHDSSQGWRMCPVCSNRMMHKTQHTKMHYVRAVYMYFIYTKYCTSNALPVTSTLCTCMGHAHVYTHRQ